VEFDGAVPRRERLAHAQDVARIVPMVDPTRYFLSNCSHRPFI